MKSCRASAGRLANDSEDCSAGQPANRTPDNIAQQPDHYCNMYHSKAKAPLPPQYCAVCNEACRHPFGPVRRPADEVLVPTCGISCYQKRWQLQGLTIGYESCEDASNSAVRPAVARTCIGNFATRMSSWDVNSAMVADALLPDDIFNIIGQALPPECLLRLSGSNRTLHRCATCDDVRLVFMHGSLLADSFASSARCSAVAEDVMSKTLIACSEARFWIPCGQSVMSVRCYAEAQLLIAVTWYYLLLFFSSKAT
jgi:hypothetical protein